MSSILRALRALPIYVVTGKTRYNEFHPDAAVPVQDTGTRNDSLNAGGALAVTQITDVTGLVAWKDYIPVQNETGRTVPYSYDANGYFPIKVASGGIFATADTWDPARKSANTTLSNGNKTATTGTSSFNEVTMSVGIKSTTNLKAYFEIQIVTRGANSRIGIMSGAQTVAGTKLNGYAMTNLVDGLIYVSAGSTTHGSAYADGDILGVTVDWSLGQSNGEYKFYKNNVLNGRAYGQILPVSNTVTIGFYDASFSNHVFTIRTTEAEFSYAVPSGFTAWGGVANV